MRAELQTCLGPCASFCSKRQYEQQVLKAIEFLQGKDETLVDQVEAQMHRAASAMQYEQAARYREDWQVLSWITRKLLQSENARKRYHFIYPVAGVDGRDIWYLIRSGKVEHAVARPKEAREWKCVQEEIKRWASSNNRYSNWFDGGANTLQIVTSWFRQNRGELSRVCSLKDLPTDINSTDFLTQDSVDAIP